MKISVIIPCFNEGRTIFDNIKKIHAYMVAHFPDFEIIAVNDGSGDNTVSELRILQQELPFTLVDRIENRGKGATVREGVLASNPNSDIVMFLDADLAIPIEELAKFVQKIERGADIVVASRFVPGLKIITPVLWYRKIMERIFQILRKIILNSWKVEDTQCGFKVFKRSVAMRIFPMATVDRFAFDAEILFIAKKLGYSIAELPISLQNPRISHVRIVRDSINMLIALFEIRLNDFKGVYKWKK